MNNFVEIFKTNTVLDTLWYASRWNIEESKIMVADSFGIMGEIPHSFGQLVFGKFRLVTVCDPTKPFLSAYSFSGESIENYIVHDLNNVWKLFVRKYKEYIYVLNIVPPEAANSMEWKVSWEKEKGNLMRAYLPVFQKFMVDALTDSLYIWSEKEAKLVKQ